jgi:antitoxin (DNA-binding transcriptional repressor) of toxin-antitoxin stability system
VITVDIEHASSHFAMLLAHIEGGEEVVITRGGSPVAVLRAYAPPARRIGPPGALRGDVWMADDFDEPMDALFLDAPLEPPAAPPQQQE